jgi:hypothetical protein
MSRSKIKCAGCKKRIPDHEPDLILQDLDNAGQPRYFHTRCGNAAYAVVINEPNLYCLTVRHVQEAAN